MNICIKKTFYYILKLPSLQNWDQDLCATVTIFKQLNTLLQFGTEIENGIRDGININRSNPMYIYIGDVTVD